MLRPARNEGHIVGQKRPQKPKQVWAIRVRLEMAENRCDLALFNMAIVSKQRDCDPVQMKVVDAMASALLYPGRERVGHGQQKQLPWSGQHLRRDLILRV